MSEDFETMDEAGDAFFENLTGKKPGEAPEGVSGDAVEAAEDAPGHDTTGDAEDGASGAPSDAPDTSEATSDPDDAEVEWKDGETTVKAKQRELKEAFKVRQASEAAQRDYAERRQQTEAAYSQATTALNALMTRAKERLEPFSKLDYVVLAKDLDTESLTQLRQMHSQAIQDVQFLDTELNKTVEVARATQTAEMRKQAEATVRELSDPKTGIPGWGRELYGQLLEHAVTTYGLPRERVAAEVNPGVMRLLHDALQFRKGKAVAEAAVKKVVKSPTNTLRPSNAPGKAPAVAKGLARLKQTGSLDDAAAAFLENLKSDGGAGE